MENVQTNPLLTVEGQLYCTLHDSAQALRAKLEVKPEWSAREEGVTNFYTITRGLVFPRELARVYISRYDPKETGYSHVVEFAVRRRHLILFTFPPFDTYLEAMMNRMSNLEGVNGVIIRFRDYDDDKRTHFEARGKHMMSIA